MNEPLLLKPSRFTDISYDIHFEYVKFYHVHLAKIGKGLCCNDFLLPVCELLVTKLKKKKKKKKKHHLAQLPRLSMKACLIFM